MAKDKIRMPSGMGGLVSYSDEYTSKLQLHPKTVLIIIGVVVLLIALLFWQGGTWFGI